MDDFTPVERAGDVWLKRDDLYEYGGVRGGKVRTCLFLAREHGQPVGLITAGARHSPQVQIVAAVGRALGVPVRCHVPAGPTTPELADAEADGAYLFRWRPGYNVVVEKRATEDHERIPGFTLIPFGMEHPAAVRLTARETANVPWSSVRRVVVPVGSGMTLAGVLAGMELADIRRPVLGVVVGRDPRRTLARFFPLWEDRATLVAAGVAYGTGVAATVGSADLDPIYEAKAARFLGPDDLLWVVGRRGKTTDAVASAGFFA